MHAIGFPQNAVRFLHRHDAITVPKKVCERKMAFTLLLDLMVDMTFRRDTEVVALHRKWKRFFADHTTALLAAGVPLWLEEAYEDWLDVVVYGYPEAARVGEPNWHKASDTDVPSILDVLEVYYAAGFPFLAPQFLQWSHPDEYAKLVAKYGSTV